MTFVVDERVGGMSCGRHQTWSVLRQALPNAAFGPDSGVSRTFSDIPSSITSTKPDGFDGTLVCQTFEPPVPRAEAVLYPGNQKHSMAGHHAIRAELQEDANCIVRREDVDDVYQLVERL